MQRKINFIDNINYIDITNSVDYSPKGNELELDTTEIEKIGISLQYDMQTKQLISYTPPPVDNSQQQIQAIRQQVLDRLIDENMTEQEKATVMSLQVKSKEQL